MHQGRAKAALMRGFERATPATDQKLLLMRTCA